MLVSYQQLASLIDKLPPPEELTAYLGQVGHEATCKELCGSSLEKVVVGKIVSTHKHPNADKLQICEVDVGGEILQIVCGAPNARPGILVACSLVGAKLPHGLEIQQGNIRGVESCGMLCSAKELGLDEEQAGILELEAGLRLGESVFKALRLDDYILDIEFTSNRGDCYSTLGLAREIAALLNLPLQEFTTKALDLADIPVDKNISIESQDGCYEFIGATLDGVDMSVATPQWMRSYLSRVGIRPHDIVVDITNYVMHMLGKPIHAYDNHKIGKSIEVRKAKEHEKLTLINRKQYSLDERFLVIASEGVAQGLAGIMGGLDSAISKTTTSLYLESAYFPPQEIKGKAKKLNFTSDAAQRFAEGVDPRISLQAIELAVEIISQYAGAKLVGFNQSRLDKTIEPQAISFAPKLYEQMIGSSLSEQQITSSLEAIGCSLQKTNNESYQVLPPVWRYDLHIPQDLVEELARIYGYDRITPQALEISSQFRIQEEDGEQKIRQFLAANDFIELINYSFHDAKTSEDFLHENPLELEVPTNLSLSRLRHSPVASLILALESNLRQKTSLDFKLFELGKGFSAKDGDIQEQTILALCSTAPSQKLYSSSKPILIQLVETAYTLIGLLGKDPSSLLLQEPASEGYYHPKQSCDLVYKNTKIASLGLLSADFIQKRDLPLKPYWAAELYLDALMSMPELENHFQKPSAFPPVKRDFSFVLSKACSYQEFRALLDAVLAEHQVSYFLFDVFQGENLDQDKKVFSLSFKWQAFDKTFTDQEIEASVQDILEKLEEQGIFLR